MRLVRSSRLELREGTSDKVYEIDLCEVGPDRFVVQFRFGRRGARPQEGTKTELPVPLAEAERVFERLEREKTAKGYVRSTGAAAPSAGPARAPDPGEPARARILRERLADGLGDFDRLVWRIGELRVPGTAPHLATALTGAPEKRAFLLARALLRVVDRSALPALRALLAATSSASVRSMAAHAVHVLSTAEEREPFVASLRDQLPPVVLHRFAEGEPEAAAASLAKDLATRPEWLDWIYLATFQVPGGRERLGRSLAGLPLATTAGAFRRVLKAAEARSDEVVLGHAVRVLETTKATPTDRLGSYTRQGWKRDGAKGYGVGTRKFLRRRAWRTLRRLGDAGLGEEYARLAAGVLLALRASDVVEAREQLRWDPGARRQVRVSSPAYVRSWTAGQILYRSHPAFVASPSRLSMTPAGTPGGADLRGEAFRELWDEQPEQLARLLSLARCPPVADFAARALGANEAAWGRIGTATVVSWFSSAHAPTAALAARMAVARYDRRDPDLELVAALLASPHAEARATAERWVREHPAPFLASPAFLVGIVLSTVVETRRLALELLGAASLPPEQAAAVVDAVLEAAIRTEPSDEATLRLRDAGAVLLAAFSRELSAVPLDRALALLRHPSAGVAELGARILLVHRVRPPELPDEVLSAAMTSPHPVVRGIGIRLYGELPDATLAERFRVLLHLWTSSEADVRASAAPIVTRLCRSAPFARALFGALVPILAAEGAEGMPADVVRALRAMPEVGALATQAQIFRLLRAHEPVVQEYGGELLRAHVDPSTLAPHPIAVLASSDVLGVRRTAMALMDARVEAFRAEPEAILAVLDARWEDSRAHAFRWVTERVGPEHLSPELVLAVCDSVRPDVQDFGRRLVAARFERDDGPRYLERLAQHPAPEMQAFAAGWIEAHAAGRPDRIERLLPFFRTVLCRPNRGRVARARVLAFLAGQVGDEAVARLVTPLLADAALTAATGQRERCVAMLAEIRARHPGLPNPLVVVEPEVRGAV